MHLPDGILPIEQSVLYIILTVIILCIYNYKLSKTDNVEKQIVNIALFSTLVFILSSLGSTLGTFIGGADIIGILKNL